MKLPLEFVFLAMKNGFERNRSLVALVLIAFGTGCFRHSGSKETEKIFLAERAYYESFVFACEESGRKVVVDGRPVVEDVLPRELLRSDILGEKWKVLQLESGTEAEFMPVDFYYVISYYEGEIDENAIIKLGGKVIKDFGGGWRLLKRDF